MDGSWDCVLLWNSGDAAYAMTYVARMILEGRRAEVRPGFSIPGLGAPTIEGINLLWDNPLILTRDNIGNYNF
jgi:simple sugar transport system substrate-binding protein